MNSQKIYELVATDSQGNTHPLAQYEGKVLLIVNTASKCGLTPQFAGLEELHKKYADRGLVVLGFPCAQFAGQELATDKATTEFCQLNYGVTFRMMKKVEVNGDGADPIFKFLKARSKHWLLGSRIKWNFTKFLIAPDGKTVECFAPTTKPAAMERAIRRALGLD